MVWELAEPVSPRVEHSGICTDTPNRWGSVLLAPVCPYFCDIDRPHMRIPSFPAALFWSWMVVWGYIALVRVGGRSVYCVPSGAWWRVRPYALSPCPTGQLLEHRTVPESGCGE